MSQLSNSVCINFLRITRDHLETFGSFGGGYYNIDHSRAVGIIVGHYWLLRGSS